MVVENRRCVFLSCGRAKDFDLPYNSNMTTKLTDEQRKAVEACAGQPVVVADEATNKVYYLLNEEAFAHLRGLQSAHDAECRSRLRALVEEGIRSGEIPAERAFADLRKEAANLASPERA
jgi:hypothetical protein